MHSLKTEAICSEEVGFWLASGTGMSRPTREEEQLPTWATPGISLLAESLGSVCGYTDAHTLPTAA